MTYIKSDQSLQWTTVQRITDSVTNRSDRDF